MVTVLFPHLQVYQVTNELVAMYRDGRVTISAETCHRHLSIVMGPR